MILINTLKLFFSDEIPVNNSKLGKHVNRKTFNTWLSAVIAVKTANTHGNWLFKATIRRQKEETNSGHVKPLSKSMSVSSFCFSSPLNPAASGEHSKPMNPATSALISGVVVLGGFSVGFFLLSLRLLQKSRHTTTIASGVWNPTFKWINICI